MATVNRSATTLAALTIVVAHRYRINAEERLLVASFGEQYAHYAEHTWKLLLHVW